MSAQRPVRGLTLDAGALIAIDRNSADARALTSRAYAHGWAMTVPAGALAQAWRGGTRQARLAAFLGTIHGPTVAPLDSRTARAAGELCGRTGSADAIGASVAVCALTRGDHVAMSDPADIAKLSSAISLIAV
ncbi:MAG: PIN domain-containing protein [Egibacteraceae bacterium]